MEPWGVLLLVLGGLIVLWILIQLLCLAFVGAIQLLAFAAEQGFVGVSVYIACWVFFFPVMLVICIIIGLFVWANNDG